MSVRKTIFALVLLFSLPALSQTKEGRNIGKLNLSAFAFKGFNLQYERQLSDRVTAALGYGKIPASTIAFSSFFTKQIDNTNIDLSTFKLGTSVFTPEVRYYFGKKGAFHGFYLAPYTRISVYKINGPVKFNSSSHAFRDAIFSGKLNMITGGLMAGSSFRLSDKLYLDWWIAGGSVGAARGHFNASVTLDPDEQVSLKKVIDNLDIPFTSTKLEVNSNGAIVTTTGGMTGIRGLGINLGIRF